MATCPACAEELPAGKTLKTCPTCGDSLDGGDPPAPAKSKLPVILVVLLVLVFAGVAVIGILAALLMPALMKAKDKANRTKCANNLRQLALASIQYADDKRYFPHVRGKQELDGDVTTNDSPKVVRSLLWFGYHDNPEGFICPSSHDLPTPITNPAVRGDLRKWFWEGGTNGGAVSPLFDGQPDPTLDHATELSYGWTRRALTINSRSTSQLAADRARRDPAAPPRSDALDGNHVDGWNVVHADGSVNWIRWTGAEAWLAGTADPKQDAFLAVDPPK